MRKFNYLIIIFHFNRGSCLKLEEWNYIGILGQTNKQQFLEKMIFKSPIITEPLADFEWSIYILALNIIVTDF